MPATARTIMACAGTGKRKYHSKLAAYPELVRLRRLDKAGRHEDMRAADPAALHVYRCPDCGYYHLGHRRPGRGA